MCEFIVVHQKETIKDLIRYLPRLMFWEWWFAIQVNFQITKLEVFHRNKQILWTFVPSKRFNKTPLVLHCVNKISQLMIDNGARPSDARI